jgi:hypothetical protein
VSLNKLAREKEILLILITTLSKKAELSTGPVTDICDELSALLDCANFLARIFKTAAKAGKI